MAAKRVTMRNIREVLRLSLSAKLSIRQISASTKLSVGSIQKLLAKAKAFQLTWPLSDDLDDTALAQKFYPKADTQQSTKFYTPNWPELNLEFKKKGITKQLLWEEYKEQHPSHCYSYSQFCDRYMNWLQNQKRSMRQQHKAGEKLFVDYAGQTISIVSGTTGEVRTAQIFVAVLGASNYTYVEATYTQSLPDWLESHVRAFEFLGGVPKIVIPDNLKSGVSKACRYDPDLNPAYQQLASHYAVAIIPARPYKPKDKSKAEVGVQIIERWILAKLRHQTFFSLGELNHCIKALLTDVNLRPFKQLEGSRLSWFESIDKPALSALPKHAYHYVAIKSAKVGIDYHVQYDRHYYSVPHHLVGEKIELHVSDSQVAVYFRGKTICRHVRKYHPGTTTEPLHMPKRHEKHQTWTPGRLLNWASTLGPEVTKWVKYQLDSKTHPEQAYRVCLGLLNLSKSYPAERLNKACSIANQHSIYRLRQVNDILKSNQDKLVKSTQESFDLPQNHENIRGPKAFH